MNCPLNNPLGNGIEIDGMDQVERYLVVDLEATCSNDGSVPRQQMEIIEIGAVLWEPRSRVPTAEFQSFVRPVRHPNLSDFCTELTGIRQQEVEVAEFFPVVLARFRDWFQRHGDVVFCSWGNYDRNQLLQDCHHHGVSFPFDDRHVNLKVEFARRQGLPKKLGLTAALDAVGLTFTGAPHRGIDDARNIARLLPFCLGNAPKSNR